MNIDHLQRTITISVVFSGPAMAGKTSNLRALMAGLPHGSTGELQTVDTNSERTLRLEYTPPDVEPIRGYAVRFVITTVPGQSYYAATRRQILRGVDGVMFVADSRREAIDEDVAAMNELLADLRHHGLSQDLPMVMQFNRQDAPTAVPGSQLQLLLNVRNWPSFPTIANRGEGVLESWGELASLLLPLAAAAVIDSIEPAQPPPASHPVTCFRCQGLSEIPAGAVDDIHTCPTCGVRFRIGDLASGTTLAPVVTGTASKTVGSASGLRRSSSAMIMAFPMPGFTTVESLDVNPLGQRMRVREDANRHVHRAIIPSSLLRELPNWDDSIDAYLGMAGPLRHPHLLPLHSFQRHGERQAFLAPDAPTHESLTRVLGRRRALAPPHALGILRQLALALDEAARHGVIHGWVRPEVVLINAEGEVLLDEIYIPCPHHLLVEHLAPVTSSAGYHLAPEFLEHGLRADVRTDIFLLGVLLFRMITGEGLIHGPSARQALEQLVAQGPRTLIEAQPTVSRDLDAFVSRMVAIDRSARFQTYHEVIEALDAFGGGAKRQDLQLTTRHHRPKTATRTPTAQTTATRIQIPAPVPVQPDPAISAAVATAAPPAQSRSLLMPLCIAGASVVIGGVGLWTLMPARSEADPPPTPVAAPAQATAPVQPSQPQSTPNDRTAFDEALRGEQYKTALEASSRIADGKDRAACEQQVFAAHEQRRQELESMLADPKQQDHARELITAAALRWGLPGDATWASRVLAAKTPPPSVAATVATVTSVPPPLMPANSAAPSHPTNPATTAAMPVARPATRQAALPANLSDLQAPLRTLGWIPFGGAWLEDNDVRMRPNSGISFKLNRSVVGFTLQASGNGYLRLVPLRGTPSSTALGGVAIPMTEGQTALTIQLSPESMVVLDGGGQIVQSVTVPTPPNHFLVISTGSVTLAGVPQPLLR